LLNFLDTDLYERQGKAVSNFKNTLPEVNSDLAQQLVKDPYCFDFASLTDRYNEKELKDALVKNIENFLIELGNGFAYMGREYRIEVGNTELFADMMFYNTVLHCYVVVEVKTKKFEPSFLGQLSGYVSCAYLNISPTHSLTFTLKIVKIVILLGKSLDKRNGIVVTLWKSILPKFMMI